jgi:hypothetical protein
LASGEALGVTGLESQGFEQIFSIIAAMCLINFFKSFDSVREFSVVDCSLGPHMAPPPPPPLLPLLLLPARWPA